MGESKTGQAFIQHEFDEAIAVHEAIVEMTGNATLAGMYQQILTRTETLWLPLGSALDGAAKGSGTLTGWSV